MLEGKGERGLASARCVRVRGTREGIPSRVPRGKGNLLLFFALGVRESLFKPMRVDESV